MKAISPAVIFLSWIAAGSVMAAGDPKGEKNLAEKKGLPEGAGLAVKYVGDAKIASHPAVIFADNFEEGELTATASKLLSQAGFPRG